MALVHFELVRKKGRRVGKDTVECEIGRFRLLERVQATSFKACHRLIIISRDFRSQALNLLKQNYCLLPNYVSINLGLNLIKEARWLLSSEVSDFHNFKLIIIPL